MTQKEIIESMGDKYVFGEILDGSYVGLIDILRRLFNFFPQTKGLQIRIESMPERGNNHAAITFHFQPESEDSNEPL